MKRRSYYVQKPDGTMVSDRSGVAIPFVMLNAARKAARECLGTIGYWDWMKGEFRPMMRG